LVDLVRPTQGLKRKAGDGTYYVRRAVPEDVRHVLKRGEFVESLKTTDSRQAERRRDEVWRRWTAMIEEARRTGGTTSDNLALVRRAIEDWRRLRCETALGVEFEEPFQWKPITVPREAAAPQPDRSWRPGRT
jgi:hypothetical protein